MMKTNIKKWLVLIPALSSAVWVFNACNKKFLNNPPTGSLASSQLANENGLQGLLTGAYAALDGQGSGNNAIAGGNPWETPADNWIYGAVAGGDNHKGSSLGDQPPIVPIATMQQDPTNGFFNDKWNALYEGVARCNAVLATCKLATTVPAAEIAEFQAEARFLRGHYYFDLTKMFGKVPWIDETTTNFIQPNDSLRWGRIEADFQFAAANLPAVQPQVGQVNKWAADAYLAKTYLYEAKYAQAMTLFDQVIAQGETSNGLAYALTARFEDNFDAAHKNNSESVFVIQQNANDGTNSIANANGGDMLNYPYNSPFRCCGFFQPTIDLANSYRTDANGLPLPDTYNNFPVKNDMNIASTAAFTPDAGNLDPRLDWTVGRRGIPFHDWGAHPGNNWIRDQASAGPYSNKKNIYWQYNASSFSDQSTWAPGNAININIIRFADVLLMDAECHAQGGDLTGAEALVNLVRARAANPASLLYTYLDPANPVAGFSTTPAANYVISQYPAGYFSSQAIALKAIYFERKLELACEGHRFFDLVRWGTASTVLNAFYAYEGAITDDLPSAHYTVGKNEVYPIPLNQITLETVGGSSLLKQNPGYSQ